MPQNRFPDLSGIRHYEPLEPEPPIFVDLAIGELFFFHEDPSVLRMKIDESEYLFFSGGHIYHIDLLRANGGMDSSWRHEKVVRVAGRLKLSITGTEE